MTSAYEINRKNRPEVKGYSIEELIGPDFIERYQNRELGKETIDNILGGLEQEWNNLDEGTRQNIVGAANWVGDAYSRARSIDETEKYNPIAYAEAGALRTIEGAANVIGTAADMTLGNLGRGAGWMLGLDPRAREALAIGSQLYLGPKAIRGISKLKPKHLGITQTVEPYIPPKGLGKQPRKKMVNITNQVDEVFTTPSFTVQEIVKVAKKNKISYAKAAEYLKLKKQGIVPTQSINPGTNAGLIEGDLPLNVIHARLMKGAKDKGAGDMQMAWYDEPVDPGDIPNIDLSTMIEPIRGKEPRNILNVLNQNGMRGGRLDIFAYRAAGKNRQAVEYYISPYSKMVKFDPIRNNIIAAMNRKYGGQQSALGLGEKRSFQAHHVVPIKASFPAFHGIVKESPKYEYYMGLYADAVLSLGNQIENIVPAIGAVDRDFDAPHHLVHMMMEEVMGKAGEKFWDDTTLESLVVRDGDGKIIGTRNDEMRERLILKQIELFKRGEDIIKLGMEEYNLYATNTAVPPEQIVDYFMSQYGTPNLPTDLKYQPQLIKKITRDAIQDFENTHVPSIVGGTLDLETLEYLRELANRPPDWWRSLNVQQKRAQMPVITEKIKGRADGYTFEQLDAYVDAGWMSQETLDKLFNPPEFESIEDIIKDVFPND